MVGTALLFGGVAALIVIRNAGGRAGELWVQRQAMAMSFEQVVQAFAARRVTLGRILGAVPGSVAFAGQRTLAHWFGDDDVAASEPQLIENPGRHQP